MSDELRRPRYPIYVVSKGRAQRCLTAQFLLRDDVPFRLVVEPQERDDYAKNFGAERVLVLPFRDRGCSVPARNWLMEHSIAEGFRRHWCVDDNIVRMRRWVRKRVPCPSGPAFAAVEDFSDRYENVAISGMNYSFLCRTVRPPVVANCHVYSCMLINNETGHRWRGWVNEDVDICLQVLADGWCTLLFNAFLIEKLGTQTMKGGNTDSIYRKRDGRTHGTRYLARMWPGVVQTARRFKRTQHVIDWKKFDTPLRLRPGLKFDDLPSNDEYGMELERTA